MSKDTQDLAQVKKVNELGTSYFEGKRQEPIKEEEEFFAVEDVFDEWDIYWPRKTWLQYHDMFNQSIGVIIEAIDNIDLDMKYKVIRRLGEKIDADIKKLELKTGKALSFKERADRLVESMKRGIELKGKKEKSKTKESKLGLPAIQKKLVKKIKSENYVLSPRSYNYLRLKTKKGQGTVTLPDYSPQAEALIDVVFHHLAEKYDYGYKRTLDELEDILKNDFIELFTDPKKAQIPYLTIEFEISDIRKQLNPPDRWLNKDFVKASYELRDNPIITEASKIWANEEGKYRDKIKWRGSFLTDVIELKRDELKPETKNVKHKLGLVLGMAGWLLFMNDVSRHKYSMFPTKKNKRRFYRMRHGATRLYRYFSLFQEMILTVPMVIDILNSSEKKIKRIIEQTEKYLGDLLQAELIKGWIRIKDKGWETTWLIGIKIDINVLLKEAKKRGLVHSIPS